MEKLQQIQQSTIHSLLPEHRKVAIFYLSTTKVGDFNESDFKKLDDWILATSYFIGISESPEQEIRTLIMNFIRQNYNDLSIEDMNLAINLAFSGKLNLQDKDLIHYNRLSGPYLSKILNAYKTYRSKILQEYSRKSSREQLLESEEIGLAERSRIMWEALERLRTQYESGAETYDINGSCYDYFVKKGVIDTPDDDERESTLKTATQLAINHIRSRPKRNPHEIISINEEVESIMRGEPNARVLITYNNILLFKFFDKLRHENKTIESLKSTVK